MSSKSENVVNLELENKFMDTLGALHNGATIIEAQDYLTQLVGAVKRTGKAGELTVKITMKPDGKGEVTTVLCSGDVKVKLPKKSRRDSVFFIEKDDTLTTDDPGQHEIDFSAPGVKRAEAARQAN